MQENGAVGFPPSPRPLHFSCGRLDCFVPLPNEIPELAEKVGGESIGSYYTSPATTSSYNYAPPLTLDNLFPVYGYSIGVQLKTLKDAGYKAQKIDKSNYVYIGKNSFWDFDGNKTMESISVKEIPSEWASKWGMTFNWSYNQWKKFLLQHQIPSLLS